MAPMETHAVSSDVAGNVVKHVDSKLGFSWPKRAHSLASSASRSPSPPTKSTSPSSSPSAAESDRPAKLSAVEECSLSRRLDASHPDVHTDGKQIVASTCASATVEWRRRSRPP
eukprot:scaffold60268_cov27-Tisochrysis_lutea.AAC.3